MESAPSKPRLMSWVCWPSRLAQGREIRAEMEHFWNEAICSGVGLKKLDGSFP